MCYVSLEPAVNGHFVCNTQIVIEKKLKVNLKLGSF